MSKLLTDCEPESTASQMGLENAFHHSLLHTFLLCHIRAPISVPDVVDHEFGVVFDLTSPHG